jgi:hypothetical protein
MNSPAPSPTTNNTAPPLHLQLVTALDALEKAISAVAAITKQLVKAQGDDDEWTRMPSHPARCHVSNFSRSYIVKLINQGKVRTKTAGGNARFYSAADVRALIAS